MVGLFGVLHWLSLANLIKPIKNGQKLILYARPEVIILRLALLFPETHKCA